MSFGEFRNTEQYLFADVICFVDSDGVELDIDNLDDDVLQHIEVIDVHSDGGYLEIMLN